MEGGGMKSKRDGQHGMYELPVFASKRFEYIPPDAGLKDIFKFEALEAMALVDS